MGDCLSNLQPVITTRIAAEVLLVFPAEKVDQSLSILVCCGPAQNDRPGRGTAARGCCKAGSEHRAFAEQVADAALEQNSKFDRHRDRRSCT
jgi:hypothetical protein